VWEKMLEKDETEDGESIYKTFFEMMLEENQCILRIFNFYCSVLLWN